MNRVTFYWLLIVGLLLVVLLLSHSFPGSLNGQSDQIRLVSGLALCSYLLLIVLSRRIDFLKSFQYLIGWVGIGLVIFIGYSFKDEWSGLRQRLSQQLFPASPQTLTNESVSFTVAEGGHFYIDAIVNSTQVRFLVDSGASQVVLTRQDADRVGLFVSETDFTQPMTTANGMSFSAPVEIDRIEIGSIRVDKVKAVVSREGLTQSLLGMSFLSRLKGWRVEGNQLILEK